MFNQIFKYPRVIERHLAAPLAEQRQNYLNYRALRGISTTTLNNEAVYLLAIIDCLGLQAEGNVSLVDIEEAADRWIKRPYQPHCKKDFSATKRKFIFAAKRWLTFLGRLERQPITPCPEAHLLAEFVSYMEHERGWSPITIYARRLRIEEFLRQVCAPDRSLSDLTPADIELAIAQKSTRDSCTRSSLQGYTSTLRAFFRYAETQSWCAPGLTAAIVSPRVFRGENLPLGPTWEDVRRLLSSIQGDSPSEIRARAILLLFAVYGLRVSEVRRLKLEDIDWQQELLMIHRAKSQSRVQTYPLSQTVGEAILRYLKEARPRCSHREVFVSLQAPILPLGNTAFYRVVSDRLRALDLPLRHYGPHSLRHACATHLLAEGLTMKEIGDHLGHRCSETTSHYARVDITGLREVADFNLGGLV
jgi:site-specific recombinase XerD